MTNLRQKVNDARLRKHRARSPRDGEKILARTDDVAGLITAVDAVRQLHVPEDMPFGRDARCHHDRFDWPCPTQQALAGAV